jgi:uncharacterized protein YdaU (DUF1376 family)
MANNLYIPFHPGDYLTDTGHLSAAEHGAYFLLILNYWQRGDALPVDDRKLRGVARMSEEEWAQARDTVLDFFEERDGLLYHKRIEEELERAREKSSKASASAKRMHNKRRANALPSHSERNANQEQEQEQIKESANAASLAAPPAKPSFEMECRDLVGEEPVLLSLDFHKLRALVEDGTVTEDDVKAGIKAAMAKPDFRIRHWSQLEGWARGAAKERLAGKAKNGPPQIVVSMTPEARAAAVAKVGKRWVAYDTAEWVRVADLWKAERGTYPPHPSGGWYFPESYFALSEAAA